MASKTFITGLVFGAVATGYGIYKWYADDVSKFIAKAQESLEAVNLIDNDHTDAVANEFDEVVVEPSRRKVYTHALFRNYLIREGKAKFGLIKRNEANRLVLYKYLSDLCIVKRVSTRHINENVNHAVEMVFIPNDIELEALAIPHVKESRRRRKIAERLAIRPLF